MVMLILTIGIGLHHGQLGLQVVWEDYTEGALRVVMIVLTRFLAVLFGLAAIVSVLRIGFGG
jgi:succinate dehydrogenase / fumarate reductase membrane anchor subunit